jgi:DNA-binding MarR family transcriptional regulator
MTRKSEKDQIQLITELGRKFSDETILMHEAIANKAGLSGTDHKYLGYLIRHGRMTAGELSKFTGLTTGAITGVIDRLEKKKLLKREIDKLDRRRIFLVPNKENITKLLGPTFKLLQNKIVAHISAIPEIERGIIEKYLLSTMDIMSEVRSSLSNKRKS